MQVFTIMFFLLIYSKACVAKRNEGKTNGLSYLFPASAPLGSSFLARLLDVHPSSLGAPDHGPFSTSSSSAGIFLDHYSILPTCPNEISAFPKIAAKSFIKSADRTGPKEVATGQREPRPTQVAHRRAAQQQGSLGDPGSPSA